MKLKDDRSIIEYKIIGFGEWVESNGALLQIRSDKENGVSIDLTIIRENGEDLEIIIVSNKLIGSIDIVDVLDSRPNLDTELFVGWAATCTKTV